MPGPTRRQFIRRFGAAAALSAFPPAIRRALAIAADRRTGTIEDVDHIVLLMMENRSFDHYFGRCTACAASPTASRSRSPTRPKCTA